MAASIAQHGLLRPLSKYYLSKSSSVLFINGTVRIDKIFPTLSNGANNYCSAVCCCSNPRVHRFLHKNRNKSFSTFFLQSPINKTKFSQLKTFLFQNFRHLNTSLSSSSLLLPEKTIYLQEIQKRFKHKKKDRKLHKEDDFSDDEAELEDDDDDYFEEETDLPLNYKQLSIHVKSPRADALLSTGLNLSRGKIDSLFYASKLLHNDKVLTKKSKNLSEGDFVDLIMEQNEETIKVKRIKVLKISSEKSRSEKISVILRAWRSAITLDKEQN